MVDFSKSSSEPAMSVVLVVPEHFGTLRRTFRHLQEQTVADQLEVIIVAPSEAHVPSREEAMAGPLRSLRTVAAGPITNVDKAAAAGIARARADVVVLVEDHAYPEPGWYGDDLACWRPYTVAACRGWLRPWRWTRDEERWTSGPAWDT